MMTDPYLVFVKCFSTWVRIRIIMVFTMIWCIIIVALTGWTYTTSGGSFGSQSFPSGNKYGNWDSAVCDNSPYQYLKPFYFTYSGG